MDEDLKSKPKHEPRRLRGNRGPKSEARALKRAQRVSEGTPEKPGRRNHMVALARSVTMQNERDKAARKHGGPAREPMGYHRRLAIYKAQRGVGPITRRQQRQVERMSFVLEPTR